MVFQTKIRIRVHLNALFKFGKRDPPLKILAFPCNQFGKQEPGSDADIKKFVENKGFQGELFQKIEVNGDNAHPLYKWMKSQKVEINNLNF